jgi:hypothetical protein
MDAIATMPLERTLGQTTAYIGAIGAAAIATFGLAILLHDVYPPVPTWAFWVAMAWPAAYVLACQRRRLQAANPADNRRDQVEALMLLLVILPLQPLWDHVLPNYSSWIFVGTYTAFALAGTARLRLIDRWLSAHS